MNSTGSRFSPDSTCSPHSLPESEILVQATFTYTLGYSGNACYHFLHGIGHAVITNESSSPAPARHNMLCTCIPQDQSLQSSFFSPEAGAFHTFIKLLVLKKHHFVFWPAWASLSPLHTSCMDGSFHDIPQVRWAFALLHRVLPAQKSYTVTM